MMDKFIKPKTPSFTGKRSQSNNINTSHRKRKRDEESPKAKITSPQIAHNNNKKITSFFKKKEISATIIDDPASKNLDINITTSPPSKSIEILKNQNSPTSNASTYRSRIADNEKLSNNRISTSILPPNPESISSPNLSPHLSPLPSKQLNGFIESGIKIKPIKQTKTKKKPSSKPIVTKKQPVKRTCVTSKSVRATSTDSKSKSSKSKSKSKPIQSEIDDPELAAGDQDFLKLVQDDNLCNLHPTITGECTMRDDSWNLKTMLTEYAFDILTKNRTVPYSYLSQGNQLYSNMNTNTSYVYHEELKTYVPTSSLALQQPTVIVPKFNEARTHKDKIMSALGLRYYGKTDAEFWTNREKSCTLNQYPVEAGFGEFKYHKNNDTLDMCGVTHPVIELPLLEDVYKGVDFDYETQQRGYDYETLQDVKLQTDYQRSMQFKNCPLKQKLLKAQALENIQLTKKSLPTRQARKASDKRWKERHKWNNEMNQAKHETCDLLSVLSLDENIRYQTKSLSELYQADVQQEKQRNVQEWVNAHHMASLSFSYVVLDGSSANGASYNSKSVCLSDGLEECGIKNSDEKGTGKMFKCKA